MKSSEIIVGCYYENANGVVRRVTQSRYCYTRLMVRYTECKDGVTTKNNWLPLKEFAEWADHKIEVKL